MSEQSGRLSEPMYYDAAQDRSQYSPKRLMA